MMLEKVESYLAICLKSESSILCGYTTNGTGVCPIFERQTLDFADENAWPQVRSEPVERGCSDGARYCPIERGGGNERDNRKLTKGFSVIQPLALPALLPLRHCSLCCIEYENE